MKTTVQSVMPFRLRIIFCGFHCFLLLIIGRLFYWQVIKGGTLQAEAQAQYQRTRILQGQRGQVFTADNYLLVGNQPTYRLFVEPKLIDQAPNTLSALLTPLLLNDLESYQEATETAQKEIISTELGQTLEGKLNQSNQKWVSLMAKVSQPTKQKIDDLKLKGLGFDQYYTRWYPEASLAAQITGFVGKDKEGEDIGYFGVEGALEQELKARPSVSTQEKDALGWHLLGSNLEKTANPNGRDITLTIRRDIQQIAEAELKKGMEKYSPKSGEVIIMEPSTGKILALASFPQYEQQRFYKFEPELYKNPSFSSNYEPGSTFKTITVAAGIDAGVIKPETECPICDQARVIGKYTIKTWNNEYHPNTTMTQALAKSDNTAMMYITDLLGADTFVQYLKAFGLGTRTYAEIQEDTAAPFPQKWGPVELATASFGQGISVTSMQLIKAVSAIANQGVMMRPMIVEKASEPDLEREVITQPTIERAVIKPATAHTVTEMMITAASAGEAQWISSKTHTIAGKTGTSQVAVDGKYDPDKTIATFIGFAPPDKPRFIMLVKLVEPQSSPWAAETAAPLWYQIANKLFLLLNIPPDH
jgi:cell division protein FtsI (penicillin-binding protein 3)